MNNDGSHVPSDSAQDIDDTLHITAFRVGGASQIPLIRAGNRGRPWMEATGERFANRCLPLVMANQMGWDLFCPVGFSAMWGGDDTSSSLHIEFHDTPWEGVRSHFGYGILTFEFGLLFRTSLGHNLWVRGPVNAPKDGISALEGLVETDWTPSTFTVNWLFTRSNHVITFNAGEAFCRLLPYPRDYLESFKANTSNMSTDPDLDEKYQLWRSSRNQFLEGLSSRDPGALREGWQKHYMQGRDLQGNEFPQHQTKLTLSEF